MRRDFLATLHCPYSGLPLSLSMDLDGDGEEINYGIVSTEATDFPIVEGILRLHVDERREPIVKHVRAGRRLDALTLALDRGSFSGRASAAIDFARDLAFRTGCNRAGERLNRLKRNHTRVFSYSGATFQEITEKLSPYSNYAHQMYRFTMPGFVSTFALVHMVRAGGAILNFACGTGHEPFLISRLWPNAQITCADYSFSALHISKRYFAPGASYVCLNGDYLLPFESGQFSTIFSSDTLPILDSKLNLAQEFRRVGDERAVTLLPHMHNRLVSPFAKSLSPCGYRQLFRDVEVRIIPDETVVRDYFFDDMVDLTMKWSDEKLAASRQHLSIIASKDPAVFVKSQNLWAQRIGSIRHPCINPAYRIAGRSADWELRRQAADFYFQTIAGTDKVCLPESCRVVARSLDTTGLVELQRNDPNQFARLARSLIVLDLPERFLKQTEGRRYGADLVSAHQQALL